MIRLVWSTNVVISGVYITMGTITILSPFVTTQPTLPQVMTESIYWFEYPVETRFYVKTTSKPAGG